MGLKQRYISKSLDFSIGANGAREGDEFYLEIFQEKKRALILNRTRYLFQTGKKFEFDTINAIFTFPEFSLNKSEYELILIGHNNLKNDKEGCRYLIRSLGEEPFRLNGIYSFEAFIERGDVLDFGFNRIQICREKEKIEISENHDLLRGELSKEIIKSTLPILLEGDTGTGKTTMAKKIHEESGRRGSFVHLNLNSFSSSLLESELFGHIKGAFTGALQSKKGAILEAHRGTLFLDEIDSLSIDLQTKLLLFLDDYNFRAVGGENSLNSDVRVIFASGSSLLKKVQEKKIRKDFYFRLKASAFLRLLPLSENKEKIKDFCLQFEKQHLVVIDSKLIEYYKTCPWPGNIRQLKSHLEKKRLLACGKKISFTKQDEELLLNSTFDLSGQGEIFESLEEIKLRYCYETFIKSSKNLSKTANLLDVCHNTLKKNLNTFYTKQNLLHEVEVL